VNTEKKTLGTAIDEIINALEGLDPRSRTTAVEAACAHLELISPLSTNSQRDISN
jgi:hypothetical protein